MPQRIALLAGSLTFLAGCGPACGWVHYGGGELTVTVSTGSTEASLVVAGADQDSLEAWIEAPNEATNDLGAVVSWPRGEDADGQVSVNELFDEDLFPCTEAVHSLQLELGMRDATPEGDPGSEWEMTLELFGDGESWRLDKSLLTPPTIEDLVTGGLASIEFDLDHLDENGENLDEDDEDDDGCGGEIQLTWALEERTRATERQICEGLQI